MPFVPEYKITPGQSIEVLIAQPDGGKALVFGRLDRVSEAATGGRAIRLVVASSRIVVLQAKPV
jgi:hypothetical protein